MTNKKKILVIDDNKDVVTSMKIGLTSIDPNYEVFCAEGGMQGLKLVESEKPDIVLLDIMMPQVDGWSVCAKIKSDKKTKDIPVIFVTAKVDQVSRMMGMKGADDYIEKPFDMRDLKEKIDKLTDK